MKLILIVALLAVAASAQTHPAPASAYHYSGWIAGCVQTGIYHLYKEDCTPVNQQPIGAFEPVACQWFYDEHTKLPMMMPVATSPKVVAYTSQAVFSAKNKYMLLNNLLGGVFVYDRATCALVRQISATNDGLSLWSNYDDETIYIVGGTGNENKIRKQNITTGTVTTLVTFDGTGGRPTFSAITLNGTDDLTADEWISVTAEADDNVCLVNLNDAAYPHYCINVDTATSFPGFSIDFASPSRGVDSVSGKRYLFIQGSRVAMFEWTTAAPTPVFLGFVEHPLLGGGDHDGLLEGGETALGNQHTALGQTADGRQFYFTYDLTYSGPALDVAYLHYGIAAFKPAASGGGTSRILIGPSNYAMSSFPSCSRNAPYCMLSGSTGVSRTYGDTTTALEHGGGIRQLILIYNAGEKITILGSTMAENYGTPNTVNAYRQYPFGSLSRDARFMVYNTNFGKMDYVTVAYAEVQRDAKNLRITERTTSGGKVRFVAPNVSDCTVTISVNANFSSPLVNAATVAGHAERVYNFTTGASATLYYVRATCAGLNADTSFTTQ